MGKFETLILPRLDSIGRRLANGSTSSEIARELGISLSSLNRYRKQYPEFGQLFTDAADSACDQVEAALLKRATGYENPDGKEIPPDVRAAMFWLKNRRPEAWKDSRENTINGPVKIEFTREEKEL